MDRRLEKALEFGNYMATLNNQKRLLKEKFLDQSVRTVLFLLFLTLVILLFNFLILNLLGDIL